MKKFLFAAPLAFIIVSCGSSEPPEPVVKEITPSPAGVTFQYSNATIDDITTRAMQHCQSHGKAAQLINTSKSDDGDLAAFECK